MDLKTRTQVPNFSKPIFSICMPITWTNCKKQTVSKHRINQSIDKDTHIIIKYFDNFFFNFVGFYRLT